MSHPINQESYNTVQGYSPELLPVGTKVVFTNDYGISFTGKTIERVEMDDKGVAYYLTPTEAPWFPSRRRHLTVEYQRT